MVGWSDTLPFFRVLGLVVVNTLVVVNPYSLRSKEMEAGMRFAMVQVVKGDGRGVFVLPMNIQ
jgi:hypothetical protein